jgi:hypothetical protein
MNQVTWRVSHLVRRFYIAERHWVSNCYWTRHSGTFLSLLWAFLGWNLKYFWLSSNFIIIVIIIRAVSYECKSIMWTCYYVAHQSYMIPGNYFILFYVFTFYFWHSSYFILFVNIIPPKRDKFIISPIIIQFW